MLNNALSIPKSRLANLAGSAAFAALGLYIIMAAQQFEDAGRTTPVFIGLGMIFLALLLLGIEILFRETIPKIDKIEGSLSRRVAFVCIMLIWILFLPYLGFVVSSILAFALISAVVPRNYKWSFVPFSYHAVAGVAAVFVFWTILTTLLNVPLPSPQIF
jgi:putative tricarboxylic transport membrane protein